MSGFSTDLLTGLAVHLHNASAGTWNTSGAYTALQTGITLGIVPQRPDRCITLTSYSVADSPALSDSVIGVQIRCRWGGADPRYADDLADSIFMLLHGLTNTTLTTGVRVIECLRNSYAQLGQDANQRFENTSNYYVTVHRPSTNRT
jgi:hypothetical protein